MPVRLEHSAISLDTAGARFRESDAGCLDIGLVNNMPDKALRATERQFAAALDAASEGIDIRLSVFVIPEVPRGEQALQYMNRAYAGTSALWNRSLDGLIVTGTEPAAANLPDEPYWNTLAQVFDWADANTHSTILSCLAAHAAVLHFDGIQRRRLRAKRCGIFACDPAEKHFALEGIGESLSLPHSRWNDLAEHDLADAGYRPLTRLRCGGIDAFTKQRKSLFFFLQGHPEYEGDTLFLEYRRDVARFLRQERESYPRLPEGYFDAATAERFAAFERRALDCPIEGLLAELPHAPVTRAAAWEAARARLYRNWLVYLSASKALRLSRGVHGGAARRAAG